VANGHDIAEERELFGGISSENYKLPAQPLTKQRVEDYPDIYRNTDKPQ
jgi:hypothetical protein